MIRLSATISKKVPIPQTQFSSQQFGASVEIEVSDADKPDAIQQRIRQLYGLLSQTIDEQIGQACQPASKGGNGQSPQPVQTPAAPAQTNRVAARSVPGNGRSTMATQAQQKAIFAICKSLGIEMAGVLAGHNVVDPKELTIKQASEVIDQLKSRQNAR